MSRKGVMRVVVQDLGYVITHSTIDALAIRRRARSEARADEFRSSTLINAGRWN